MKAVEIIANYNRLGKELEAISNKIVCAMIDSDIEEANNLPNQTIKLMKKHFMSFCLLTLLSTFIFFNIFDYCLS